MGGYLYTSAIVFSIGATAGVLYREVIRCIVGGSVMGGFTVLGCCSICLQIFIRLFSMKPIELVTCIGGGIMQDLH